MSNMVSMNLRVSDYASRVFGVIKEKYGLHDKSEAVEWFARKFGSDFVEQEATDEYVKKILEIQDAHFKKHGYRKMSDSELDKLFGK